MNLSSPKQLFLEFIISIVILVILCLIFGLEIIVFLPFLILYGGKLILGYKYQSHQNILNLIAFIAFGFCLSISQFLIKTIFVEQQSEVCGKLVRNDNVFFYGAFFNQPNIVIDDNKTLKEFNAKFHKMDLNSQVCITYIKSDTTIWFYNDYVLDIIEIK